MTRRTAYERHHDCETCSDTGIDLVLGGPCTNCERDATLAAALKRIRNPPPVDPVEAWNEILHDTYGDDIPEFMQVDKVPIPDPHRTWHTPDKRPARGWPQPAVIVAAVWIAVALASLIVL